MKLATIIFDLDGTIIESEDVWGKAYSGYPHTRGVSVQDNWKNILSKYNVKTDKTLEELEILTCKEFEKLIPVLKLKEGFFEFLESLEEQDIPLALATSTRWETTSKILEEFDLQNVFECITTGEEVALPKPDPEIFLYTSEKLGIDPVDCLVIEYSQAGVTAAKEAGMKVIAISDDEIENADLVVESFGEITQRDIMII